MHTVKPHYVLLLLLIFPFCAFAQKEFGTIQGTISDIDGGMIPGVTVTASSPSLVGATATTFSAQDGFYRFPALSPGVYEVKAGLAGFQTVAQSNIRIFVGNTVTLNFALQMLQVSEALEVSGTAPLVNLKSPAVPYTIPAEAVQNLPKPTQFLNLLSLTPGVGDDLVAYGAAGASANRIGLDGVDISSPGGGGLLLSFSQNWVEEVQVEGIAASAEYGGFTGANFNVVTRSGGNDFHGLAETFFANEKLVGSNVPNPGPEDPFKLFDTSVQIGGPLIPNKLSFFSGARYFYNQTSPFGYMGVRTDEQPMAILKLTSRLDQKNTLQGFIHYDSHRFDGVNAGFGVDPVATSLQHGSEASWNSTWISLLGSGTVFETRFGGFWFHQESSARNDLPGHKDLITGRRTVNARLYAPGDDRLRAQVNASLSHHARDFILGDHDFRFGVEFERSRSRSSNFYNGGIFYLDYNGAPFYRVLYEGYDVVNYNHRTSTFAQDSWSLTDKLTLDLGVRWDHNRGIIPGKGPVFSTDPVAPRLGFTYDVKGDQKTIIKGHYGKYYEGLFANFYGYANDQPDVEGQLFYNGNWYTAGFAVNYTSSIDPGIRQPYIDQVSLGIEQQLPLEIALSAHYIQRRWHDLIDIVNPSKVFEPVPFVNPVTGETITVYSLVDPGNGKNVLTNPPSYFWRYDGLELVANRQFSEKLYLGASLFLTRARGSIPNLSNFNGPLLLDFQPNQRINAIGRQLNDPTVEFQIQGSYNFPWGINTGWFFRHGTGDTWTPTVLLPKGVVKPEGLRIFALPRGTFRLDPHNLLDLRVEKMFPVGPGQLLFTADIFNVFNSAFATSVQDSFESQDFGEPSGFNSPREIRLGIRYTF